MPDAPSFKFTAEKFRLFNRCCTDKHRLSLFVSRCNFVYNRRKLAVLVFIYKVRKVNPTYRLIRRNCNNIKLVDFTEFLFFRKRRTGHTGKLIVKPEVILKRNCCDGFVLVRNFYAFLGFNRLVQTLAVASAEHDSPGKFINYKHLTFFNDIVYITAHDSVRPDCKVDMVHYFYILGVCQILDSEISLRLFCSSCGKGSGSCLFVNNVIRIDIIVKFLVVKLHNLHGSEGSCEPVGSLVKFAGLIPETRYNKRSSRFIDKN